MIKGRKPKAQEFDDLPKSTRRQLSQNSSSSIGPAVATNALAGSMAGASTPITGGSSPVHGNAVSSASGASTNPLTTPGGPLW